MTREDSRDQKTGIRTIKQADLWEISPVTFPMNDAARISAVKSIEEITDFKSAERFLREAGNLSRSEATAFIARVKGLAQRESAADDEVQRLQSRPSPQARAAHALLAVTPTTRRKKS
jgi:alanyl-tRNA synthetase